jgi:hypothetical protein
VWNLEVDIWKRKKAGWIDTFSNGDSGQILEGTSTTFGHLGMKGRNHTSKPYELPKLYDF